MRQTKISAMALCLGILAFSGAPVVRAQDAQASTYPNRVVKLISPFAPGGATDVLARLIAQKLGENWKQTVIVENKAGGGGIIAAATVARAEPDGYTLLLGSVGPIEVLPSIMTKMPYDAEKDFAPIDMLVNVDNVLVINEKTPVKTMAELIVYAKVNPGKLHFGSSGIATTGHLAGEVFKQQAGVDIVHVPYRGGAPAALALLAGEVDIIFSSVPTVVQHIKTGRLRALAVTGEKSIENLPGVRTIKEQGLTDYRVVSWYGILAPARTSTTIVNKINADLGRILAMPDVKTALLEQGWTTAHVTPPAMVKQIKNGIQQWKLVTEKAGIKPE